MSDNQDTWAVELELAHETFRETGSEAGFRVDLERLGFVAHEIEREITIHRNTAASTDETWARKMRKEARNG